MFSFEFLDLNFRNSYKMQYAYRLAGFNKHWLYTDTLNPRAVYTNVPPGEYTFEVKSHLGDEIWNPHQIELKVIISPPWWKTWLAISVFALSFILVSWFLINLRIKQISRRQNEKNKALMNAELLIKKNELFASVSHELRTPLTVLQLIVEELKYDLADDVGASYNVLIVKINEMNKFIGDLYEISRSDSGSLSLNFSKVLVQDLIEDWTREISSIVKSKGFIWSEDIELIESIEIEIDVIRIKQVVNNIIGNSMIYTNMPGEIRFITRLNNQQLEIIIYQ